MSDPVEQSSAPGADVLEQAMEAYGRLWRRQLDTVNEVWKDITSKDAKFSTWTTGYSKLLHAWTDNAREVFGLFSDKLQRASPDCPVLSFVLDKQTEASKEQTVPLPHGADPSKIVCTPLAPLNGAQPLAPSAQVTATPDLTRRSIDITVSGLGTAAKQGSHFAVVYQQLTTGASPPRKSLALVIVSFIPA
jgi:hypothetical protein